MILQRNVVLIRELVVRIICWLSAVHIPGSENVDADFESRNCSSSYEWCLDHSVFSVIMKRGTSGLIKLDLIRKVFRAS